MKKIIRKLIMWAFDNKVTHYKTKSVVTADKIELEAKEIKLNGYTTTEEHNALEGKVTQLVADVAALTKENTTTENSDVIEVESSIDGTRVSQDEINIYRKEFNDLHIDLGNSIFNLNGVDISNNPITALSLIFENGVWEVKVLHELDGGSVNHVR